MFNLDDDNDYGGMTLTHMGEELSLEHDDFDETNVEGDTDSDNQDGFPRKRGRTELTLENEADSNSDSEPKQKKSKNEVMKEVIAKSKMYKHERQQAKDEDLDAMEDLDKDIDDLRSLLYQTEHRSSNTAKMEAENDLDYDAQVREMIFDKRAKPSDRTKTDEELAEDRAEHLRKLEEQRLRRMRGEVSDEEGDRIHSRSRAPAADDLSDEFDLEDDATEFGLSKGLGNDDEMATNDEDEGDADEVSGSEGSEGDSDVFDFSNDEEQQESKRATKQLFKSKSEPMLSKLSSKSSSELPSDDSNLAFTYPCPSTYNEFRNIVENHKISDHPVIVDRIIVLHHPSLHQDNKVKLMVSSHDVWESISMQLTI